VNFEDLESFNFKEIEGTDCNIVRFKARNNIDEIPAVDLKLYKAIPETIGRHNRHDITLKGDTERPLFSFETTQKIYLKPCSVF
jgi:hypothetical protein